MKKLKTNRDVQEEISGMVQKKTWSMIFQKGEMYMSDVVKKGYQEQSVRIALKKLVELKAIVKVEGVNNFYRVNGIVK